MDISRFGNFPLPLAKAMMDIASSHFAAPCKCMHASFIHTCEMRSFSFKSSRCHREKTTDQGLCSTRLRRDTDCPIPATCAEFLAHHFQNSFGSLEIAPGTFWGARMIDPAVLDLIYACGEKPTAPTKPFLAFRKSLTRIARLGKLSLKTA